MLLLTAAGAGVWYWNKNKTESKPIEYRTGKVLRGDIIQTVTANGQITPVITVQVGCQVSGNIVKLYADFNSKVTNGQLIAELDPATYESRLIQAEGELANAKAQMTLARANARRAQELSKNSLISQADLEQVQAELEQREAAVKMREANLKSAQVDLERTKIYSPIDGMVISRNVDVGQTVQASFSAPTLFNIANDLTKMEIGAMVSEADIGNVEEGQEASFTVEAFPNRTFQGKVAQVRNQPTTNQNVVNYATIIEVRNADMKLKPGMTANVTITTERKDDVLKVPNSALRFRPPEGANVVGAPSSGTNATRTARTAAPGTGGGPNLDAMPPEIRERILARFDANKDGQLDETERAAMREARGSRGGPGGGGGEGGGFGGGLRASREISSPLRNVYLVSTNAGQVELKMVQAKVGISDGAMTEVLEGLKDGDVVATGIVAQQAGGRPTANNPFAPTPPFGGRGGRPSGGRGPGG